MAMTKSQERRNTVCVLNTVELGVRALQKVLGNDCAKTLHGNRITRAALTDLVAARVGTKINDATRGVK